MPLGCTEKRLTPDKEGVGVPRLVAPSAIPGKVAIKPGPHKASGPTTVTQSVQVSATREGARMVAGVAVVGGSPGGSRSKRGYTMYACGGQNTHTMLDSVF